MTTVEGVRLDFLAPAGRREKIEIDHLRPRRRHGDASDGDRLEVFLRSPRPVFIVDVDRGDVERGASARCASSRSVVVAKKTRTDGVALFDRGRAEVVDDREQQVRGVGADVDRRV